MGLNLKNEETHRLVRELASLTGESMTQAVTESVRERLQRVEADRRPSRAEELLRIGRECAELMSEEALGIDHGELLYGEDGLPR